MKDSWSATEVSAVAIPFDAYRGEIDIQLASGGPVYLGFGEPAVVGKGVFLASASSFMPVTDYRARMAIHMICAVGTVAEGGYQTA